MPLKGISQINLSFEQFHKQEAFIIYIARLFFLFLFLFLFLPFQIPHNYCTTSHMNVIHTQRHFFFLFWQIRFTEKKRTKVASHFFLRKTYMHVPNSLRFLSLLDAVLLSQCPSPEWTNIRLYCKTFL
ncbi:hypothetical protein BD408DRAFT_51248 [Parasitella parasitica]|nr:hypothetical protein BD408DRAFT_51248 [Parasitella parasitica]